MDKGQLELLLQRFNFERYVQEQAGEKEGWHEYLLVCPHCGREKLSVNVKRRRWRCFICEKYKVDALGKKRAQEGAGGPLALVRWLEGVSGKEAIQRVSEFVTQSLGNPTKLPETSFYTGQESELALCPTGLPEGCFAVESVLPYMERRGITLEDAKAFGLGWCAEGWVANRLVFPVWEGGQCIYWQARAMWDAHERHLWEPPEALSKGFRKTLNPSRERRGVLYYGSGDVVLNLEQASRYPRVAITEGPTSAIRVGPDAVATFGKQLQPKQIARLIHAGVRAVDFMWDGPSEKEPEGAWTQMIQAAGQLAPFCDVRLVFLPRGDPGDYSREELNCYRAHARPYSVGTILL